MQVIVDGILTNYLKTGTKPKTVLLLHGWADKATTFDLVVENLSKEYSCVSIDLPGFGASEHPDNAWSINDYSNFIGNFLTKLGIKPELILGHSNGGAIAINLVAENIYIPKKLILLASAGIRERSTKKSFLKIAAKSAKIATRPLPVKLQQKIKQKSYKTIGSDYMIEPSMKETFKNIVSYDIRGDAEKVTIPTLLIYGENDNATPPRFGKILASIIKKSKLEIIKDGDHFIHQNNNQEVNKLIQGFIK